jgi:hypothetical protein
VGNVRRAVVGVVTVGVVVAGGITAWTFLRHTTTPAPGCVATAAPDSTGKATQYTLDPDQAGNAATIAAVGLKLGMPDHAVTVALATAMQESKLRNLPGGDRDSIGLFQQRPSQGWGTATQVADPVYASTAFYKKLSKLSNWTTISVTEAAQAVQHSGAPEAYAQWEVEARAVAGALTGERQAALTCHNLVMTPSGTDLASAAGDELGTSKLTGQYAATRGWQLASWLVAHADGFNVDQVRFDGQTWTASSGTWAQTGAADGALTVHQATTPPPTS